MPITESGVIIRSRKESPGRFQIPEDLRVPSCKRLREIPLRVISTKHALYLAYHVLIRRQRALNGSFFDQEYVAAGMGRTAEQARITCLMEMVEKASASSEEVVARLLNERRRAAPRLDWRLFAPYDPSVRKRLKTWVKTNRDLRVYGQGLCSGKTYEVPAQCVVPWWGDHLDFEDVEAEYDGSGVASGLSDRKDRAMDHALREVLERDAFMLSWRLKRWHCRKLVGDLLAPELKEFLRERRLQADFYDVGDPRLETVVLSLVSREDGSELTCGAACEEHLKPAIQKAFSEAVMLQTTARHIGKTRRHLDPRLFRDSYDHILYGYRKGPLVSRWYRKLSERYSPNSIKRRGPLEDRCRRIFGFEPILIDLTSSSARKADYFVCRILIPGAYRKEWTHQMGFWGGKRLLLSMRSRSDLNRLPHPFG
jgi:ribosomal protein S12 methylthiotransferase accessory factor YcaO